MELHYKSGMHQTTLTVTDETNTVINFEDGTEGTLIVFVEGEGNLNLTLNFEDHSNWTYLWINRSDASLNVNEKFNIGAHVQLRANYGELSTGSHTKKTVAEFLGSDSNLLLKGASIAFNKLNWDLIALHHGKRTHANLENYAIVLENAKMSMEVTGQIDNGFSGSETHQITRIMNLGETVNAVVFPKLLISENDVAASHAATVGQPDEEHIYYLQARGIDRVEALKILTKGYLLPITTDIEDEDIKKQLIEEIEMKVDTQWNA